MSAPSHADTCRLAADALAGLPASCAPQVLIGFDGFVDRIVDVVQTRTSPTAYTRFPLIAEFGAKVTAAAGKSAGIGAVAKQVRLGGNGPLMANGMCAQGAAVSLIGVLGNDGAIEPVFQGLAARAARTITLGPPATTDALEFDDGKVMLNFSEPMNAVSFDGVVARSGGMEGFKALLRANRGIATVNWSQTPGMTDIWRRCAAEVLPGLRQDRPLWFVDLADPHRCPVEQVRAGMEALQAIQRHADVVLGLNENECRQICAIFGCAYPDRAPEWEAAREACVALRAKLGLSWVMCHLVRSSAVAWERGSVAADGFFEPKPKTTTGAGDHFNAGFFAALLSGVDPLACLQAGGATSGHYVRTGESPTRAQQIAFLRACIR